MPHQDPNPCQCRTVLATPLVRLTISGHAAGPHADPPEEQWAGHCAVFTEAGNWRYRDSSGRFEIGPKMVVLGSPRRDYSCRHDSEFPTDRCLDVWFHESLLRDIPSSKEAGGFPFSVVRATPRLFMLKARLGHAIQEEDGLAAEESGQALLEELQGVFSQERVLARPPLKRRQRDSAEAAREYMARHFARPLRLQDLAASVGLSPFHFSRIFRGCTGRSPYAHLRELRLRQASRLLRRTRRSVTDVALDVGFNSLSLFINSFRGRFGASPSAFRGAR